MTRKELCQVLLFPGGTKMTRAVFQQSIFVHVQQGPIGMTERKILDTQIPSEHLFFGDGFLDAT